MHDVYAYGVIAPSTLIELGREYPAVGGYAEIAGIHPSIGGEAAGGAYVLARLGVTTKLSGTRLGSDDSSRRTLELLKAAGVDCSGISVDPDSLPVSEVVLVTDNARTVLGTYGKMLADSAWNGPSQAAIRASRIVCLDPFFGEASRQAALWCREAGIPYVTVDVPPDSPIAHDAEVLVVSQEFAWRTFGTANRRAVWAAHAERCSGLVIVTGGGETLLYGRKGAQPKEFSPFTVEARDTTGAGDSFRAGVIYGMLNGYSDARTIETAAAVAAMVCQRVPGVLNSPTEREVVDFLGRADSTSAAAHPPVSPKP